jgi:flagellar motor protein MotB
VWTTSVRSTRVGVGLRQPGLWGRVFGGGLAPYEAVDANMLAKGYGSASPVAGNDTLEGRFGNRRIEYRVVKPV